MQPCSNTTRELLALTLVPGLGPVRIARLIEAFGSVDNVRRATHAGLASVPGIGPKTARSVRESLTQFSDPDHDAIARELDHASRFGVRIISAFDDEFPIAMQHLPAMPPILYVRGTLDGANQDRYAVGLVGSRRCTAYGLEQAGRFAGGLARAGLTIVSGGARGIDTASHRGALLAQGRTIAVLGCGLACCYPPENQGLFDEIVEQGSALISELPMQTPPDAKNFPARNRIISALSLGVLVIEASKGSGALITAAHAAEDHGREVMAIPGRIDSQSSAGSNGLIRDGGARLVLSPGDVIETLESIGFHAYQQTLDTQTDPSRSHLKKPAQATPEEPTQPSAANNSAETEPIQRILQTLESPMTLQELTERVGLSAGECTAALTRLELAGKVKRDGPRLVRT